MTDTPRRSRRLKVVVSLLVLALAGAGVGALRSHYAEIETDPVLGRDYLSGPRPVRVTHVVTAARSGDMAYPGTVKASRTTKLAFRVGGPLIDVCVRPGDVVEKGQVLMRLDPRDFRDRIAAVTAQIDAAAANLRAMKAGARDEDIQSLEARLRGAKAQSAKAGSDFQRARTLFEEHVIPQSQFDQAQSALDVAAATVSELEQSLKKARAGARAEDIAASEAAIRGLETQLRIAQHQLEDTELRAPYRGVITRQIAENYEMVESSKAVIAMHDISELEIEVSVPEIELIHRQVGREYVSTATFPAIPGRTFEVAAREWNTEADPITRTYSVTFVLSAPEDMNILPGMTAEVSRRLKGETGGVEELPVVPASAVCSNGDGSSFVWVFDADAGRASRRTVTLGMPVDAARLTVLSGVVEGERIVAAGADLVTADMALKAVE